MKSDKKKSPLRKMSFRKIIGKSPKDKFPNLKLSDLKTLPDAVLAELNSLQVLCDFHSNGCRERLSLSSLTEHTKSCKYIDEPANATEKETKHVEQQQNESNELSERTSISEPRAETNEMDTQETIKRKDSENKSVNGEAKISEEAGSDDFVVIHKEVKAGSASTKSTESVQTTGSDAAVISGESKENVSAPNEDATAIEKKKKKKKKKKTTKSTDEDAVSLDATSLKSGHSAGSQTQSKESLAESEELKRALKDAETKSENLRLINNQLLAQIRQLKEEKEEFNKQLQSQLGTGQEVDELKDRIQQLERENKSQALRIVQLIDSNENMNKFIMALRDEQLQLREKYNSTLNDVQQISKLVKTCKQEV